MTATGRRGGAMRLEIGAGERPDPGFDIHADVLPLPGIDVVCRMDALPFLDATLGGLRANHVLEHQSWQLVPPTLREWARVLVPGAPVEIGVPDARFIAERWLAGELGTEEANHWLLGGHAEREPHRGVDGRGVPLWIWNAHHTLFDAGWLKELLQAAGFEEIEITRYDTRNLRCRSRRAGRVASAASRARAGAAREGEGP